MSDNKGNDVKCVPPVHMGAVLTVRDLGSIYCTLWWLLNSCLGVLSTEKNIHKGIYLKCSKNEEKQLRVSSNEPDTV